MEEKTKSKTKSKKKEGKLHKDIINIIRTTQRNNIDLTNIADNKANVLLSLNGIMLTFLVPMILSNLDLIIAKHLYLPLLFLGLTCFLTMFISATVLKPSNINDFRRSRNAKDSFSPFFFGNFYNMEPDEFHKYMKESLTEPKHVKYHLAQDLYYVGKRLAYKLRLMRWAFNLFLIGIFLTLLTLALVLS